MPSRRVTRHAHQRRPQHVQTLGRITHVSRHLRDGFLQQRQFLLPPCQLLAKLSAVRGDLVQAIRMELLQPFGKLLGVQQRGRALDELLHLERVQKILVARGLLVFSAISDGTQS